MIWSCIAIRTFQLFAQVDTSTRSQSYDLGYALGSLCVDVVALGLIVLGIVLVVRHQRKKKKPKE
jgi:hypothetical protein